MKVLWFCNTPANADEYFDSELKETGGWLKALDQSLQQHVQLHIAFYKQYDSSFRYKESFYYPIKTNKNIVSRIRNRFSNRLYEKEDLNTYLNIIKTVAPDIIHIHGMENPYSTIINHTNIPIVISIQGNITAILHKYFNGYEKKYLHTVNRRLDSFKDFFFPWSFSVDFKSLRRMQPLEIKNLKMVKNIMGRTEWDKRITRVLSPNSKYFHEDRILRSEFYYPINRWKPQNRERIIISSTISNSFYKGFETICLALNELNKLGINCEWRVAGINNNDLIIKITKAKLENLYPTKGLVFLGSINEKTLIRNLLDSDIYVMSSHIENNANSLCEAMILGLPCISTFVGGIGSLIKDGENGILIQDGDPWALAGSVLELINDKKKTIKLSENARETAMKRHDIYRITQEILKSYRIIINKKPNLT